MAQSSTFFSAKNILIFALAAALIICIFFLLKRDAGDGFVGKVANLDAIENIRKYRNRLSIYPKTKVVMYDSADIRRYLDTFSVLRSTLPLDPDCRSCKWMIGFYFVRQEVNGGPRTDFYVIPTYVDTSTNPYKPVDFFDPGNRPIYTRTLKRTMIPFDEDSIAYNTGHLWP